LTTHLGTVAEFEASLICGGHFLTDAICQLPQPLTLSPGLHLIGLLSATAVVARCVLRRCMGLRRVAPAPAVAAIPPARMAAWQSAPALRPGARPVRPRRQFGLRGVPH
jgi:hypothetical protein